MYVCTYVIHMYVCIYGTFIEDISNLMKLSSYTEIRKLKYTQWELEQEKHNLFNLGRL